MSKTVWLPIHEVFGKGPVPKEAARIIRLAIEKVRRDTGTTAPDWMVLEWISADFIGKASVHLVATSSSPEKNDDSGEEPSST